MAIVKGLKTAPAAAVLTFALGELGFFYLG